MKITKCYISSFGIIKDKTYTFNEGINTIKEDNGCGKTTLSIFIKSMFYGLNNNSRKNIDEMERKKYQPWQNNDRFGGYIEFFYKDKQYRIERFFGKKESDDTIKLIDLETLTEYKNNDNLGERLFGIDENGFLSTCFLSQNELSFNDESVISKFNDICETNNSNTFANAIEKLDKKSKEFKLNRGEGGILYEDQKRIFELNNEISKINSSKDLLFNLKNDIKNNEQEIEQLKKDIDNLENISKDSFKIESIKLKKENYGKLKNDVILLEDRKKELNSVVNNNLLNEQEYNNGLSFYREYLTNKSLVKETKNNKNFILVSLISFALFIFSLIIYSITKIVYFIPAFLILFVITIVFALLNKNSKKNNKANNANSVLESSMNNLLIKFGYTFENEEKFLLILNKIKDISNEIKSINVNIEKLYNEIKTLEKDEDIKKEIDESINYELIKNQIKNKQSQIEYKVQEIANKKANIDRYEELYAKLNDYEEQKTQITQKFEEDKQAYSILNKTIDFLNKANENLKLKYREPLEVNLNKYLKNILSENFSAKIDTNLNIFVEEKGELKEVGFYSKGIQNIIEICKRFALIDVLFTIEKPFIVLDDVFTNLDENKLKESLISISKLSKDYQIIYFICHESRRV